VLRVIATHFSELIELLQSLNEDETESVDKRGKAAGYLNIVTSLLTFDFVCFLSFWEQEAAADLGSLRQNLTEERE